MPSSRRPTVSPGSGSSTRHRLIVYLMGVAIGCLLLGWFTMRRSNESAAREWQRNAAEQQEAAREAAAGPEPTPVQASENAGPVGQP